MNAREEILARITQATAGRQPPPAVPRDYLPQRPVPAADLLELLAGRLRDYRATVQRGSARDLPETIAKLIADRGSVRLVRPAGVPRAWLPNGVRDEPPLRPEVLDRIDGVLTTCALAIAETGTIVLDHGAGQGRRAVTLVPDHHIAVVLADQVVGTVPDAVALLDPGLPMTWISGPSATSDIELRRVEGVHGPRRLDVVIIDRDVDVAVTDVHLAAAEHGAHARRPFWRQSADSPRRG